MNKCTKKNCPFNAETLNPDCDLKSCPYRTEISGDLISRKQAINELKLAYFDKDLQSAKDDPCVVDAMTDWAIRTIKRLPSEEDSISINDWLSSFNTDSATVCFTEIQKLKEQIGTLNNCTNCKYKDLRNYNYPCVNCSNNYTNMFENKEN